jgi:hypothetical protein
MMHMKNKNKEVFAVCTSRSIELHSEIVGKGFEMESIQHSSKSHLCNPITSFRVRIEYEVKNEKGNIFLFLIGTSDWK